MSSKTINLSLPAALLKKVDAQARKNYASRSDYVRQVLVESIDAHSPKMSSKAAAWAMLLNSADDMAIVAEKAGYVTDADFSRLAKEVRGDRRTKQTTRAPKVS